VDCPNRECGQQFMNEYYQQVFPGLIQKLDEEMMKSMFEMVECGCGNQWTFEAGDVDYNIKDEDGNPISKKAAKHFAKNRVRCPSCEKNFCRKCKAEPYHMGKNCDEHKDYKDASKCRFCLDKLKKINKQASPAF